MFSAAIRPAGRTWYGAKRVRAVLVNTAGMTLFASRKLSEAEAVRFMVLLVEQMDKYPKGSYEILDERVLAALGR